MPLHETVMHTLPTPQNHRGFTLVEIAIVMVIMGFALGMLLPMTAGMLKAQKGKNAQIKLTTIDTALANYVALNRRLPCPANGTLPSANVNAGREILTGGGLCNPATQINGVVPWVTLGLSEDDAMDPWFGRILYRVDPQLARGIAAPLPNLLMNMTTCDPIGTSVAALPANGRCQSTVPCITTPANCHSPATFLANKGLDTWNGVGAAAGWANRTNNRGLVGGNPRTGAAYVLISQGPSSTGAYNSGGALQAGTIPAGTNEIPNQNGRVIAIPSALATTYREAPISDAVSVQHFDDYLSHPTIMAVLQKANLGPRTN